MKPVSSHRKTAEATVNYEVTEIYYRLEMKATLNDC